MNEPNMEMHIRGDMKAMSLHMAQFIDVELKKRGDELKALAEKVVAAFDFEKELRQQFEYAARQRIQDLIRVETAQRAIEMVGAYKIEIVITPKGQL